jgi:phosphate-selective porin OprO/OprP
MRSVHAGLAIALLACGAAPSLAQDRPAFELGSHLHVEPTVKVQVDTSEGDVDFARKRVGIQGHFFERFEYQLERELDSERPWRDAFVDAQLYDGLQVRGGRFKVPFGLDQLTSPTRLDFVYRSRIGHDLTPGRDVGGSVHGRLFGRRLAYDVGMFAGDGDNARWDENPGAGPTAAGRVVVSPFRAAGDQSALRRLEFGFNGTVGRIAEGRHSVRSRDVRGDETAPAVYVNGSRQRFGADVSWRYSSFSIAAEGLQVREERLGQGIFGEDLPLLVSSGWYVSGSWLLTGETKTDRVTPRRPLLGGGAGAIELAARLERIGVSIHGASEARSIDPRAASFAGGNQQLVTLGVNGYVNRWIKLQANAIRDERLDAGAAPGWTPVFRFQFVL